VPATPVSATLLTTLPRCRTPCQLIVQALLQLAPPLPALLAFRACRTDARAHPISSPHTPSARCARPALPAHCAHPASSLCMPCRRTCPPCRYLLRHAASAPRPPWRRMPHQLVARPAAAAPPHTARALPPARRAHDTKGRIDVGGGDRCWSGRQWPDAQEWGRQQRGP
jgi:hypothetical protein